MSQRTLIDHAYRRRIRALPCVVAVFLGRLDQCAFDVQACHFNHSGMGGKDVPDHGNLWPGCLKHHDESHNGIKTFQRKYRIDLKAVCLRLEDQIANGVQFPREAWGLAVMGPRSN